MIYQVLNRKAKKKGAKKVLLVFCSWPARYAKEAKEQTMKGWTSTARTPVTW